MDAKRPTPRRFEWEALGDIQGGRPNLGPLVPVAVYRLLQYTMRDVLAAELGTDRARELTVKAGRLAGREFCLNTLDRTQDFGGFAAQLQRTLREQGIGILRIEKADLDRLSFTLTVSEDLDCSGLPCTDEVVCQYDEGFIAGILEVYAGRPFAVKEVDCWSNGARVCRFQAELGEGAS